MTNSLSTVIEFKPAPGGPPSTAEEWCARLHADDVTKKDRAAFEDWVNASADHRAEYELCALTFGLARGLAEAPELKDRFAVAPAKVGRRWLFAVAATVLMGMVGLIAWKLTLPTYKTGVGEQKLVALADGTTVQLNTASAMKVDLKGDERQVTLDQGEAFFNVAPDPSRPFVVRAGLGEIRVIGTKFNVRVEGDKASVVVLEGHVKVDGVDLLPGEGARMATAQRVAKMRGVNASKLTSWREGKIYFDHDPLAKVLKEVNRYTETPFIIETPRLTELTLSGVFRTGDTDSVAFALRETYGIKMEREDGRIRVY